MYLRQIDGNGGEIREKIVTFAAENSMQVVKSFVDPAECAVLGDETNFRKMIVQLHAGEADVLITDRLSTLLDDMVEQELILANLRASRISVVCVEDPTLSSADPGRRLLRDFSSRGDFTRRFEALRLTGKRLAARQRGDRRKEGARPYGQLAGEDRVLTEIHELTAHDIGPSEIARRLNEQGVSPRRGKRWHPTTIANILGARRTATERKARRATTKQSGNSNRPEYI